MIYKFHSINPEHPTALFQAQQSAALLSTAAQRTVVALWGFGHGMRTDNGSLHRQKMGKWSLSNRSRATLVSNKPKYSRKTRKKRGISDDWRFRSRESPQRSPFIIPSTHKACPKITHWWTTAAVPFGWFFFVYLRWPNLACVFMYDPSTKMLSLHNCCQWRFGDGQLHQKMKHHMHQVLESTI